MARSPAPGTVAADPLDDATWMALSAARVTEAPPQWLDPESCPADPEDPGTWCGDFEAAAAQAGAEGAEDASWRKTLLDAGIGTGWAHTIPARGHRFSYRSCRTRHPLPAHSAVRSPSRHKRRTTLPYSQTR